MKAAVAALKDRLPSDVEVRLTFSTAEQVERAVDRVKSTIVEGALLTVLIVFLFLHSWRSTVITGLTLPLAVVATFIALYAFGFTINFLTLMALSLCIGLLIDDAIVVRENIVRHLSLGKDHATAAREGTDEIGLAVMATTFAIVAVFVPIAFMSGVIGRFFFQFGMTVAVAVLVSLFISFTLDPMLSSVWHDPAATRFKYAPWLGRFMAWIERGIDAVHVIYGRVLRWALAHRKTVSASPLVSFFGSFAIVPLVGTEFMPQTDQSFISLRLNTPVGSSLEYTDTKVREVESVLQKFPEIELAMTSVGIDDGRNYARVNLQLVERAKRSRSQKQLEGLIRDAHPARSRASSSRSATTVRSGSTCSGPTRTRCRRSSADFAAKVAKVRGHRRPRDIRQGRESRAVDPAQQRCRLRPRHHRAAGGRDDPAAARRRHDQLLAWARWPELRGQRAVVEGRPPGWRRTSATCT